MIIIIKKIENKSIENTVEKEHKRRKIEEEEGIGLQDTSIVHNVYQ